MTGEQGGWRRFVLRRRTGLRTTWTFRVLAAILAATLLAVTSRLWGPTLAEGLICSETTREVDAILIDNLEQNYLLFERAQALKRSGIAADVYVPTKAAPEPGRFDMVSAGIVGVMADIAQLHGPHLVPIREVEPISLNAALQVRSALEKNGVRSVVVVTPAFRSRRSAMVYSAVFEKAGIRTYCTPVFGGTSAATWTDTWHGIQQVTEQFVKLQYYRFYVLQRPVPAGAPEAFRAG